LGDASSVKGLRVSGLYCDGLVEIIYSKLVVAHVLIDKATRDKDGFVFRHFHQHATEAL